MTRDRYVEHKSDLRSMTKSHSKMPATRGEFVEHKSDFSSTTMCDPDYTSAICKFWSHLMLELKVRFSFLVMVFSFQLEFS